ncbi:MAG: FadR family transcriptional regulator [Planctomycetaceae bacterium]|nr:FadR family transcriptional regulator [Planctomycetaceae bacterium]
MTTKVASAARTTNGVTSVLDSIWEVVRQSDLKVGDQIPSIRELSDRLKVKQSAVRDAILKAETMGLVTVLPRAGAFLRNSALPVAPSTSPHDGSLSGIIQTSLAHDEPNLFYLLDARRVIEIELVGRVAEQRRLEDLVPMRRALKAMLHLPADTPRPPYVSYDVRFHNEIARLAGNHALFSIQRILMQMIRPHLVEVPFSVQRRKTTDESHAAIYQALVAGDPEKARTAMRVHLSLAYDSLLKDIEEVPKSAAD